MLYRYASPQPWTIGSREQSAGGVGGGGEGGGVGSIRKPYKLMEHAIKPYYVFSNINETRPNTHMDALLVLI